MRLRSPLIAAAAAAVMLAGSPVMKAAADTSYQSIQLTDLTLQEAVEKTLGSNIDLAILRLDLDSEEARLQLARFASKSINAKLEMTLDRALSKYESLAKAEKEKELKRYSVEAQEKKLKLDTARAFYEVLYTQENLELKMRQFAQSENEEGKKAIADAEDNFQKALSRLNEWMGESDDVQWKLNESHFLPSNELPALELAIEKAWQQRPEILKKQAELKAFEVRANIIYLYSSLETYRGQIAKNDVKKAGLELIKLQEAAKKDVTANYGKLESALAKQAEMSLALQAAEEADQKASEEYQKGRMTLAERRQAEESWYKAKADYLAAVYACNLAFAAYEFSIGE
ncbi:TolC family protein [Brevibacillus sp. B_LB10_24]|uniref:TolC family protein n=1 Tax=Brevibacillus sp. B_LB10_24 TaxID=3380645 RepID=UPI0038BBADEF